MSQVRSARGDIVDFQLIEIKQQLASAPTPVSVENRRRFIDEKDGIKTPSNNLVDALSVGLEGAQISNVAKNKK